MRPANEQGVVAVLDTLAECRVVRDALDDPMVPGRVVTESIEHFGRSTGVRFHAQTQEEPHPPRADAYVELIWRQNPEFRIEQPDVEFVKNAALRILQQKGATYKIFNRLSKRTKAARTILKGLELSSELQAGND